MKKNKGLLVLCLFSLAALWVVARGLGEGDLFSLRAQVEQAGFWAPVTFIVVYMFATALVLPSTVLNVLGGALFGVLWGTVWTTIAAIGSAVITFLVTRHCLSDWILKSSHRNWKNLDAEIREGGIPYLLAIRLFPIIPYGIVNYTAGLTSVNFRDYLIGTSLGTLPGLVPFIMLGANGVESVSTGQAWNILLPLTLISFLIAGTTWYRRHKMNIK